MVETLLGAEREIEEYLKSFNLLDLIEIKYLLHLNVLGYSLRKANEILMFGIYVGELYVN